MSRSEHGVGPRSVIQIEAFLLSFMALVAAQKVINIITGRRIIDFSIDLLEFISEQDLMRGPDRPSHFPISFTIELIRFYKDRA